MQSQSQMKQYIDYVLPEQINNRYTCTICSDIVKHPTQLPCNHIFCLNCVERWLRENGSCPYCRAQVDKKIRLKVNQQVEIEVENLMIYCAHHPERCAWKGLRRDYENHKQVCAYHLIPKGLVKPIGQNEANFEEKRHIDPGSLMARLLNGVPDAEKQYRSNIFHYLAECKKKDGEVADKYQIKRAAQKLSQRTSDLRKNYPDYFKEETRANIEKRILDHMETEQLQGNKSQRLGRKPRQQKSRGQKKLEEIDAQIAQFMNISKQRLHQMEINDGRGIYSDDDDGEQDNSFVGHQQNRSMFQFQEKKERREG